MRRTLIYLVLFSYFTVMAGTEWHMHLCDDGWMTELGMLAEQSSAYAQQDPKGKMDDGSSCRHPLIQVRIDFNQLVAGVYSFRSPDFTRGKPVPVFNDNRYSSLETFPGLFPGHSPPRNQGGIKGRQAFLGVFLI